MELSKSSPITSSRRRRSMSEAHELAAAWRASGKNQAAWCRSQGIAKWTLKSCLFRVNRPVSAVSRPRSVGAVAGFIAVHPPAMVAAGDVRIELGGGAQIVGLDLAGVVAVMLGLRAGSR